MAKILSLIIITSLLAINLSAQSVKIETPYKEKKVNENLKHFQESKNYDGSKKQKNDHSKFQNKESDLKVSDSEYPEAEISAAINPTDSSNMIVTPMRSLPRTKGSLIFPVYYTKDGGETWNSSNFVTQPPAGSLVQGGGDPVIAFDENGTAFLTWIYLYATVKDQAADSLISSVLYAYSTDGGETWRENEDRVAGDTKLSDKINGGSVQLSHIYDKHWLASDHTGGKYHGNIYLTISELLKIRTNQPEVSIVLFKKEQDSNKFSKQRIEVTDSSILNCQYSSPAVDRNGNVHVTFLGLNNPDEPYKIFHAKSTDGGDSFGTNRMISPLSGVYGSDTEKIPGIGSDRVYPSIYCAADNSGGSFSNNLYVSWCSNGPGENLGQGMNVYFSRSTDGGESWDEPLRLNNIIENKNNDCFNPAISINPEGKVVVAWYDRSLDTNNFDTYFVMSYSEDGGKSFSKPVLISSKASDHTRIGLNNDEFGVGEYTQILALKDHVVPFWADGRNNNGDVNVYMAKVPYDTVKSSVPDLVQPVDRSVSIKKLSPQPADDYINIDFYTDNSGRISIEIFDINGSEVLSRLKGFVSNGNNSLKMSTAGLQKGFYLLKIKQGHNYTFKKFIKR